MRDVNPDYAHESSVGPVFDVGTWVPPTIFSIGWLTGLVMGLCCASIALYVGFPDLLGNPGPIWLRGLRDGIQGGHQDYPWAMFGGSLLGLAVSYVFISMCIADQLLHFQGTFFLRAGPGGISLRVPTKSSLFSPWYAIWELDEPWTEFKDWGIVQHKQFGAVSPNSGDLYAELHFTMRDGCKQTVSLSGFREPGRVIMSKFQDAVEMVPWNYTSEGDDGNFDPTLETIQPKLRDRNSCVTGCHNQRCEVEAALRRVLDVGEAHVICSDSGTEKFIQFIDVDGSLLLDLPSKTLTDDEWTRAANYFHRIGLDAISEGTEEAKHVEMAASKCDFQADLGSDVVKAAQITLDVFKEVYDARPSFELQIEEEASYF